MAFFALHCPVQAISVHFLPSWPFVPRGNRGHDDKDRDYGQKRPDDRYMHERRSGLYRQGNARDAKQDEHCGMVFLPNSAMDSILPINICAIYSPLCSTAVVERCHVADWLGDAEPTAVKRCRSPCVEGLKNFD